MTRRKGRRRGEDQERRREGRKKVEEEGLEREEVRDEEKAKWLLRFLRQSPAHRARRLLVNLRTDSEA